jgi:hypothetical protein
LYADGRLIKITNSNQFFYTIDSLNGLISLNNSIDVYNKKITSVIVTVNVADISLMSLPNVNCQVSFRFTVSSNPLIFIGSDYQSISLCEDVPIKSSFFTVAVFDSSFSMNQVCFSILNNTFFDLINGNNTSNGTIIVKTALNYESFSINNLSSVVSFTAYAYFCNNPNVFIQQNILVTILNVNEYAPFLEDQILPVTISLNSSSNYLSRQINVNDKDAYPFNKPKCFVQNDKSFTLINNQNSVRSRFF